MKKKAKKKSQKTRSQFRKRRNIKLVLHLFEINDRDLEFFKFITKASREGRL